MRKIGNCSMSKICLCNITRSFLFLSQYMPVGKLRHRVGIKENLLYKWFSEIKLSLVKLWQIIGFLMIWLSKILISHNLFFSHLILWHITGKCMQTMYECVIRNANKPSVTIDTYFLYISLVKSKWTFSVFSSWCPIYHI